jgi:hypothetical protein
VVVFATLRSGARAVSKGEGRSDGMISPHHVPSPEPSALRGGEERFEMIGHGLRIAAPGRESGQAQNIVRCPMRAQPVLGCRDQPDAYSWLGADPLTWRSGSSREAG